MVLTKRKDKSYLHRLEKLYQLNSLVSDSEFSTYDFRKVKENTSIDCGWGKLIFAQTYNSMDDIIKELSEEEEGKRNIAFYVQDPQILNMKSNSIFIDPSVTYRLYSEDYIIPKVIYKKFKVRYLSSIEDAKQINKIYREHGMVEIDPEIVFYNQKYKPIDYFVAEDYDGNIIGTIISVDHYLAFNDPQKGTSFWSLAVSKETKLRGVGKTLVNYVANRYFTKGYSYVDLSVIYTNKRAIKLYKKLNFKKVPIFCMKHKSNINKEIYNI